MQRVMELNFVLVQLSPFADSGGIRVTQPVKLPHFNMSFLNAVIIDWRAVHGFDSQSISQFRAPLFRGGLYRATGFRCATAQRVLTRLPLQIRAAQRAPELQQDWAALLLVRLLETQFACTFGPFAIADKSKRQMTNDVRSISG